MPKFYVLFMATKAYVTFLWTLLSLLIEGPKPSLGYHLFVKKLPIYFIIQAHVGHNRH